MKKVIFLNVLIILFISPKAIKIETLAPINQVDSLNNIDLEQGHECRLYAAISTGLPDSIVNRNLITDPRSLKNLAAWGNVDGWGVAYSRVLGQTPAIRRGKRRAYNDSAFDSLSMMIDSSACKIILAHIRNCTNGCCCHGCDSIEDPHPFWRAKNNKAWSFIHNGSIKKSLLMQLIGPEYLVQNPPNGSGIPQCNPSDSSLTTDSELFFLLLLKHIERNHWDTDLGIREALIEIVSHDSTSLLNFIMSDSYELWAFCKGHTLFSLYDSLDGYTALASVYPSTNQGNWHTIDNYGLIHIRTGERPIFDDLRAHMPPIVNCIPDTSLLFVPSREIYLDGFSYSDPDNNNDSVTTNIGHYSNGSVYFYPQAGTNLIALTVRDLFGNVASCTTKVTAIPTDYGSLSGAVTDTGAITLNNVRISALRSLEYGISDSTGNYSVNYLVPGNHDILFQRTGYMDTTVQNVLITANSITQLNVSLHPGCSYRPGDSNHNGEFNGLDVTYSINYLKGYGPAPSDTCQCQLWGRIYSAADANGNCVFNGIDITYSVNFLKGLGPAPKGCPNCLPIAQ
jgi:hypothetical protein